MFVTKLSISLEVARQIAGRVENEAIQKNLLVAVAVVDEAGYLVYFIKTDNSTNACGDIAIAKARHAVNYRRDTRYHEEALKAGQLRVLALPNMLAIEGGIQLLHQGRLVGAVGVSGASAADDGYLAQTGVTYFEAMAL